ncbi:MAG: hypothetical protein AAF616_03295 [Bacteroidota bacterium]
MRSLIFSLCFVILFASRSLGQVSFDQSIFLNAEISTDTSSFTWSRDATNTKSGKRLPFRFTNDVEFSEVSLSWDSKADLKQISLINSADFNITDSVLIFENNASFKVRFTDLSNSRFLKFLIKVITAQDTSVVELPLQPFTDTYVELYPDTNELFIGEEKVIELTTNQSSNLIVDNRWTEGLPINYRITRRQSRLFLHLLPSELGKQELSIDFTLKQPQIFDGQLRYTLDPLNMVFEVNTIRLAFLQFDRREVTPKDDKKDAIEIQLDNHPLLRLDKTYRIEAQEERGGALVAELFTKTRLSNNRVLCLLRPYAFHRRPEGYLYIKDGDQPLFVTNLDITPKTSISTISIQRQGEDWIKSNKVYPGEVIGLKLEGQGLHKAVFSFPGANDLHYDSLLQNENISFYQLKIPENVSAKRIEIVNHGKITGKVLQVAEHQKPRPFDFIQLDMGTEKYLLDNIEKPIYFEGTLTDLVFNFNRNKVDQGQLYGKQYLTIKIKISNKKGNLIELYQFDNVVICPGARSARFAYYNSKNCRTEDINLNNFISKKTSDLEEWSRIELIVSHQRDKYGGEGSSKKMLIHLKRDYNFDIDVSFPAGLLILKASEDNFTNFGGVSLAMIAQMSFYQPGKIAKKRPYKVGAGFIAIDAFNFSENASNRDVGLVVIGSLYPTSSDNKLTFPLYIGGGYLLSEKKPFFLIGPGIRVRF